MQTSFTITQDLTFAEFFRSTLYFFLSGKRFRLYLSFIFVISLLSALPGSPVNSKGTDWLRILSGISPILVIPLTAGLFSFLICLWIYKSKPYLFRNVSYDFTHWGIMRSGERTEFAKPWREVATSKETKAFFLLYSGTRTFTSFKKRVFESESVVNDFRSLLKEKLKK